MIEDIIRTTIINQQKWFNEVHGIDQNMPEDKTYERFEEHYQDFITQGYTPSQAQQMSWDKCELAQMRKRIK